MFQPKPMPPTVAPDARSRQKKAMWRSTLRHSTAAAYSLVGFSIRPESAPLIPYCQSHPITLSRLSIPDNGAAALIQGRGAGHQRGQGAGVVRAL